MAFSQILKKNMCKYVLFLCASVFASGFKIHAQTLFSMNDRCLSAQKLIHEFRFDEAELIIQSETELNPHNIALPWLTESIVFLKLFISEDEALYKSSSKAWSNLISQMEKVHFNNAWYRHVLSDMHIHRGLMRLKFNDNLAAGVDLQNAFKYLKDNRKMFSSFLPDNKNYGLLACLLSAVPAKYQVLTKLIGMQGNMAEGLKELETYLHSDQNYKEHVYLKIEAAFIYAMIQCHVNEDSKTGWETIEQYTRNFRSSMLQTYMRSVMAGYNNMNDEMLEILKDRPAYHPKYPFYYIDYLTGMAKMHKLDPDAGIHFKIYTVKYKGRNYIKSAYKWLSWLAQIKGDEASAKTYYSLCRKHGYAIMEEDKHAEYEAEENLVWPQDLLKARMLFDGRYYEQSMKLLKAFKISEKDHIRFRLEHSFRKARIHHEKGEYEEALKLYASVSETGKKQIYFYAAYSALHTAFIYEKTGKKALAHMWYKKAKDDFSDNREFSASIEQKSKAGIKRTSK